MLNPETGGKLASEIFPTDKAYSQILDRVCKDPGRNIDFSKQGDREAIGNAPINHIKQSDGKDVAGDMVD